MTPLAADHSEICNDDAPTTGSGVIGEEAPPGLMANIGALLFRAWLAVSVAIGGIVGLPFLLLGTHAVRWFCRQWARGVLVALRVFCNIRHDIAGREYLPQTPAIIAANHQSMWETVWLFAHLKKPVVIVKEELISVPIFGFWLRKSGAISIDRKAGATSVRRLIRATRAAIDAGSQVVIFPEGTRLKPGMQTALKPGIAGIYATCKVPVTVIGHNSGLHWFYPGWQKRPGIVRMQIAQPLPAGLNRDEFLDQLETTMRVIRPDLQSLETANPAL